MASFVISHVPFGPETLPALRAGKWPLVQVDSFVDPEILLLTESLITPLKRALIRLRPFV